MTNEQIRQSKDKALDEIKKFLSAENVDEQFETRSGDYYSNEKFIVTWNALYKGMVAEYKVEKCDAFYTSYSGYKAIYGVANLFLEKQLKGFPTIEYGLIYVGMELCKTKEDKEAFWEQYAQPYNARVMKKKNQGEGSKQEAK